MLEKGLKFCVGKPENLGELLNSGAKVLTKPVIQQAAQQLLSPTMHVQPRDSIMLKPKKNISSKTLIIFLLG